MLTRRRNQTQIGGDGRGDNDQQRGTHRTQVRKLGQPFGQYDIGTQHGQDVERIHCELKVVLEKGSKGFCKDYENTFGLFDPEWGHLFLLKSQTVRRVKASER